MTKRKLLLNALILFFFFLSMLFLFRELRHYGMREIVGSLLLISPEKLLLGMVFTALNYLFVTGYDLMALRHIGVRLPLRRIIFSAFIGDTVSNVAGYSMLSGGAVRYRYYSSWHIPFHVMAEVVVFISLMLWLGLLMTGGLMFIAKPSVAAYALRCPVAAVRMGGIFFVAIVVGYAALGHFRKRPLRLGKRSVRIPPPSIAVAQVLISSADWLLAASALYVLLPRTAVSFFGFLAVYLPAQFLAIISQVPGGLGVFESVVILLFPKTYTSPEVLAALITFRIVYYVLPFLVAMGLVTARGLTAARSRSRPLFRERQECTKAPGRKTPPVEENHAKR